LPFGSRVAVTNLSSGRSVSVRITDRGPFVKGRCIDLSRAGANAIGMGGLARVSVQ
jgi:rare lipoprotein A